MIIIRERESSSPHDVHLYGSLKNLILTNEQVKDIRKTWKNADDLIDKVSCIVANMEKPPRNHYAYIHKIGISDGFEKIDADEAARQEEKEKRRRQQCQELEQQMEEEWYRERMAEYNVSTREEVDVIAHEKLAKLEDWKKKFGK